MQSRLIWIIAFTVACVLAAVLLPAMPQPLDYHAFADHRRLFGVDHFADVASNVGFLLAGLAGLVVTFAPRTVFASPRERWPYAVFFAGVLLTAFGSGWYHLAPDNERLVWDRLPMTIAFMGLIAAQVVDRATERAGAGNVVPYGVLQGYAMVVLVLLAWLQPSRYTRGHDLYWVFAWYALAKVLETFDAQVLAVLHVVGGHALKHVAAAMAGAVVVHMLWRRSLATVPVIPER